MDALPGKMLLVITSLRSIGATQAFLVSITESATDKDLKNDIMKIKKMDNKIKRYIIQF